MFGIKLGLDNIVTLLHSVNNPHKNYGIVHVAGTNGKGSVCAFLRTMLIQAGYRVGCYTSPHLHQFNERITVDNQPIADDDLAALVDELRTANPHLPATFFEFTTALALLYFARRQVDIVLLEVGMGGRLDATNVVTPLVSVITPVSNDHGCYLGDSLAHIGAEKGGIIKAHVPVVIAKQQPDVQAVLENIAADKMAPTWCYGRDFQCCVGVHGIDVISAQHSWYGLQPQLLGVHQQQNLAAALMALNCLSASGYPVSDADVAQAVAQTTWPGRLEWIVKDTVPFLLDGAHNEAGATALAAYLSDYLQQHGVNKVRLLAGFKADKDVTAILMQLLPLTQQVYAVAPPIEQAYPVADVVAHVVAYSAHEHIAVSGYPDVVAALHAAQQDCRAGEIVVVAGSLFLVAACREYLIS
ncbi:MAG: folylpolyglutamate synthase/dihydrofolate synthase family protein [Desulfuromonas sp.]|nr:folylpolyglutamate synthase/dihydrofolate synthase family protein [Desulfuromonas sp.]